MAGVENRDVKRSCQRTKQFHDEGVDYQLAYMHAYLLVKRGWENHSGLEFPSSVSHAGSFVIEKLSSMISSRRAERSAVCLFRVISRYKQCRKQGCYLARMWSDVFPWDAIANDEGGWKDSLRISENCFMSGWA
jgi:hypothetical protein